MKKLFSIFAIPALVVFLLSSCLKVKQPPQQTCTYDPCAYKAPDSEITAVKQYLDSMHITATQHCSGLFYNVTDSGSSVAPVACSAVSVIYKGWFTNGQVFDSSNSPVDVSLAQVIQGWTNGVPLIKQGGKIRLYIPPSLGYGAKPYQSIPGNSILIFDVNLVRVY